MPKVQDQIGREKNKASLIQKSGPFNNIQWAIHLEGEVLPVPEASTYGMMLAGLGLVGIAAAKRRKQL